MLVSCARSQKRSTFTRAAAPLNYEDEYGFTAQGNRGRGEKIASERYGQRRARSATQRRNYYQPLPNQSHDHDGDGIDDHTGESVPDNQS